MIPHVIYQLSTLVGHTLGKFLDDGKLGRADLFEIALEAGTIREIINSVRELKAEMIAMDTETAQEAGRLFREALGASHDKTIADELWTQFLSALPAVYTAKAKLFGSDGAAAASSLSEKWNAIVQLGDHIVMLAGLVAPKLQTTPQE